MPDEYSLYEAKAQLSALVRRVREGQTIVITVHGEPAAELRPIQPAEGPPDQARHMEELVRVGAIRRAKQRPNAARRLPIGERKKGALKRFLDERE